MKATTRICTTVGCSKPQRCRGLCDNCYRKARKSGLQKLVFSPKPCSVDGCEEQSRAYGMCPVHYGRVRHHGDASPARRQQAADVWDRTVETESGCLEWTGARTSAGYGQMWVEGRQRYTHRLAWEVAFGSIPDGLLVCHHCDNPPCCNPNHFFLGTVADNTADMIRKGRHRPGGRKPLASA